MIRTALLITSLLAAGALGGILLSINHPITTIHVNHRGSGRGESYDQSIYNTITGTLRGAQVGFTRQMFMQGTGTLSDGGHAVTAEDFLYNDMNSGTIAYGIVNEHIWTNKGKAPVAVVYLHDAQTNNGAGATTTEINDYVNQTYNSGSIDTHVVYRCHGIVGTGATVQNACLRNDDPNSVIATRGQIINATKQEVAPSTSSQPNPERYYWGVDHGAAGGIVTNMNTTTLWAPFFSAGTQTFSRFGIDITTPATGSACSIAVYSTFHGTPETILLGPYSVSADKTGTSEHRIASPYASLPAGIYMFGVNCTSNTVAISAYTENAAFRLFAPSTPTGSDVTPTTAGTAFGAAPTIEFIANLAVMPQIWIRR